MEVEQEYGVDFVMIKVRANKATRKTWKIAAINADMPFEVWVTTKLNEAISGGHVHSVKQTARNKRITEGK